MLAALLLAGLIVRTSNRPEDAALGTYIVAGSLVAMATRLETNEAQRDA